MNTRPSLDHGQSRQRVWNALAQPRCEGCARFVPSAGHHPSDHRWCDDCMDRLPTEVLARAAMTSRFDAERAGWPLYPLSYSRQAA